MRRPARRVRPRRPPRVGDQRAGLDGRPDGRRRRVPRDGPGRGTVRAAAGDGGRPVVQAGDPICRAARRRALLPDAPHPGRWRRPAPRPLVDRRRWASQSRRRRPARRTPPRVGGGARRGFRAGLPAGRPAQRRHDRRRQRPSRRGLRRRRRRPPSRDPRDRQVDWRLRRSVGGGGGRRRPRDVEPARLRLPRGGRGGRPGTSLGMGSGTG